MNNGKLPPLLDIVRNPHFVQIAAFLHVPWMEYEWSSHHPTIPVQGMIKDMSRIVSSDGEMTMEEKTRFIRVFADFASQVVMEDLRLYYSEQDMEWLVSVLDGPYAKMTLGMLLAYASCKETYFTTTEMAELMEQDEAIWKRKAARHEVPGVIKKGRGWLFPLSGCKAIGLLLDYIPPKREEGEEEIE